MKISIITPSHNTKHLHELQESILSQTFQNWEWVVLLNNGASFNAKDDPRIRLEVSLSDTTSVGALKKEACSHCTGDVIAEVDHDDMITPDCLEKLAAAFAKPEIGFVYSDNAKLSDSFKPYNPAYGWTWRMFDWKGLSLYAMNSQPLYPGRMGYIWFAPDHIRAWRKSVYDAVGGHNPSLSILDDQDLMHRFFMVTKFHHIPEVLYIYRITGNNTWLERNAEIQKQTVEMYNQNIYKLAERWATINNLLKIDLCGGFSKPDGYLSIDLEDGDITADLNQGIPLADNSVGVVRAHDALEHIKDQQHIMKEIHRVLAPGGLLLSSTPSTDGRGAWQDPTHVSFWNQNSFWYWTRPQQAQYICNTSHLFRECSLFTHFPTVWHKDNNISYVQAHLEKLK
jgi:O-antigen biosynthesis protein